jgi:prepilin-type processing-associated H-X9-DG protein
MSRTSKVLLPALMIALLLGGWKCLETFRANMTRDGCANNLHQIGLAMLLYANAHGGEYPDSLTTIARETDLNPVVYVCPLTDAKQPPGPTSRAVADQLTDGHHLSHVYAARGLKSDVSENTVLAFEPLANHGDGMNVLFGDGRVEFVQPAEGARLAARVAAGESPVVWNPPRAPTTSQLP